MARPKKEGLDYFPHDTDAVNDEKIEALRMLFGNDGYAFYFILLERIYRTDNFELDISDAETIQILAKKIDVTEQIFNQILFASLKRGCFDQKTYDDRKILTSNGIKKRAGVVLNKRLAMQERYRKISASETTQETHPESTQSKVKKSKVKKSKVKDIYTPPILILGSQKNIKLNQNELDSLKMDFPEDCDEAIEFLSLYIAEKGDSSKSKTHNLTIRRWVIDAVREKRERKNIQQRSQSENKNNIQQKKTAAEGFFEVAKNGQR